MSNERCQPFAGLACDALGEVLSFPRGLYLQSMGYRHRDEDAGRALVVWRPVKAGGPIRLRHCPMCGVDVGDGYAGPVQRFLFTGRGPEAVLRVVVGEALDVVYPFSCSWETPEGKVCLECDPGCSSPDLTVGGFDLTGALHGPPWQAGGETGSEWALAIRQLLGGIYAGLVPLPEGAPGIDGWLAAVGIDPMTGRAREGVGDE